MKTIIWPEKRTVSDIELIQWAKDSWFNGAPVYACEECGKQFLSDDERGMTDHAHEDTYVCFNPVYDDGLTEPATIQDAIAWLSDTGEVTFSDKWSEVQHDAE